MNWRIWFRELTSWRPKNGEESPRIAYENVSKALQKHLGLDFFSRKQFFSLILRDFSIPEGLNHLLCPPSLIYRRKEGGGCHLAWPGELGCFHQKALPSFGTLRKAQVGLVVFALPFSPNTPPFLCFYGLRNNTCFPSRMLRNFTDYTTNAHFPFGMLRNFTDYATMLVSRVSKGANKVQGPTASTPGWN